MNENEIWLQVVGYEGLYEVSNLGRVKSLNYNHTKQEKILKFGKRPNGYLCVNLWKDKKRETCSVHRLVANAFIPNTNNYPYINHKDENKENNFVDNLEWCTNSYNQKYGNCPQKIAEKLSKKVYQYSKDGELLRIWNSTMECKRNGFNQGEVAKCCRNEAKSHKGFIWSYIKIKKEQG